MSQLSITCLCGAVRREVKLGVGKVHQSRGIDLCHCFGCRRSTGQLYASYFPLDDSLTPASISGPELTKYTSVPATEVGSVVLYFCSTCGCHVFRTTSFLERVTVEVATGTIVSGDDEDATGNPTAIPFASHINVASTNDGGISVWMSFISTADVFVHSHTKNVANVTPQHGPEIASGAVAGSCLCGRLQIRINPPNGDSKIPHSGFADMIIPFHTEDPDIKNPHDAKWWLRQNDTKYMAGLCACKSCRLASGFELQSWAFVPRFNIDVCISVVSEEASSTKWRRIDFDAMREAGVLRSYSSSSGVLREFCPTCGATAFWHDIWRPDLIDVSVGLLNSREGARAESILDWWTTRVSFSEDATLDRTGAWATRAEHLVQEVEKSMLEYPGGSGKK